MSHSKLKVECLTIEIHLCLTTTFRSLGKSELGFCGPSRKMPFDPQVKFSLPLTKGADFNLVFGVPLFRKKNSFVLLFSRGNGYSPPTISPLTINNVNKLNRAQSPLVRGSPLNQLSRATPTAQVMRTGPSPGPNANSLRSTPINGLYTPGGSNQSNSSVGAGAGGGYTEQPNIPVLNGRPGGSRPNSRIAQPLNQLGMRSTPTRGLSLEEVSTLDALKRHFHQNKTLLSGISVHLVTPKVLDPRQT